MNLLADKKGQSLLELSIYLFVASILAAVIMNIFLYQNLLLFDYGNVYKDKNEYLMVLENIKADIAEASTYSFEDDVLVIGVVKYETKEDGLYKTKDQETKIASEKYDFQIDSFDENDLLYIRQLGQNSEVNYEVGVRLKHYGELLREGAIK